MGIQYRLKKEGSLGFREIRRRPQRQQLSHTREGFIDKTGMEVPPYVSNHQQTTPPSPVLLLSVLPQHAVKKQVGLSFQNPVMQGGGRWSF